MANLSVLKWRNGASVQQFCPFPVGGVYISSVNCSPSTLWVGTAWERISSGTFLASSGGQTSGDYAIGATGGADFVTLTVKEIPPHTHAVPLTVNQYSGWSSLAAGSKDFTKHDGVMYNDGGGGGSHENRPPYLSVDMWRRTA